MQNGKVDMPFFFKINFNFIQKFLFAIYLIKQIINILKKRRYKNKNLFISLFYIMNQNREISFYQIKSTRKISLL